MAQIPEHVDTNEIILQEFSIIYDKFKSIKLLNCEWIHVGEWLKFGIQHYEDTEGTKRTYEVCERTTKSETKDKIDGVDVIGIHKNRVKAEKKNSIVLVVVYRAPVGKLSIEFPAGLINPNEAPEVAAIRELKEETGETGLILSASKIVHSDPWKSTECSKIFVVEVTKSTTLQKQHLDADEFLSKIEIPLDRLLEVLETIQDKFPIVIEAKLYTFALGLQLGRTL